MNFRNIANYTEIVKCFFSRKIKFLIHFLLRIVLIICETNYSAEQCLEQYIERRLLTIIILMFMSFMISQISEPA